MSYFNWYKIHETADPSSPIEMEGLATDIIHKYDITSHELYKVLKSVKKLIKSEHYIEAVKYKDVKDKVNAAKKEEAAKKKAKPNRVTKFKKKVESVKWHLDVYGNTGVYKDINKIVEALENDGYFVSVVHEEERRIRSTFKGETEVWPEIWILTLIKKEEK